MGKIFVTSDTHFCHSREFLFKPRGFDNIEDHDKEIIARWNEVVSPDDIVYHLGDVMLNDNERGMECLRQLNGNIKIIRGNHDSDVRWALYETLPNVECIGWATMIKYKKFSIYLSHYPTITGNFLDNKKFKERVWSIHGHTHAKEHFNDNFCSFNCCLDACNNQPIELEEVLELFHQNY